MEPTARAASPPNLRSSVSLQTILIGLNTGSCAKCIYSIASAAPSATPEELVVAYKITRSYNTVVNICSSLGLANRTAYDTTPAPNGTTAVAFVAQKTAGGTTNAVDAWLLRFVGLSAGVLAVGTLW